MVHFPRILQYLHAICFPESNGCQSVKLHLRFLKHVCCEVLSYGCKQRWDITPYSSLNVNRCLEETRGLYFQDRRINRARKRVRQVISTFLGFTGLHGVISQTIEQRYENDQACYLFHFF
jgi:hypothetical protein